MKKLAIMLLVIGGFLSSCEKVVLPLSHPILGDWRVQSCQVSAYTDDILVDNFLIKTFYSEHNKTIRFIDRGVGVWIYDDTVYRWFSWEVDADNLLITEEDVEEPLSYKIHIEADNFLFTRESVYNINCRVVFSYTAFRVD